MSQVHQIQLKYDANQDRGLLRIRTRDDVEFRFWMTRRFVKLLWPMLVKVIEADEQVRSQADEQARSAVMSFKHESAISRGDFSTPFEEPPEVRTPLGESPILLSRIQIKRREDGTPVLTLLPLEGQGVQLALDQTILHSLTKLIVDTSRLAEWDLELGITRGSAITHAAPERVN